LGSINIFKILKIAFLFILSTFFLSASCSCTKDYANNRLNRDSKFIYVLQSIGFKKLKDTKFDIAIIDPDDSRLTKGDLGEIHKEDKIILAYLSIGEAEDYRDYWKDGWETGNPSFIGIENPDWEGNYKVQYWEAKWQEIILYKLGQIIDLGYDGVYLDIIDACEYYERNGVDHAKEEMVDFVIKISETSKEKNNQFLIVPQNSEELVSNRDYLEAIDGIGREDLWFNGNKPQDKEELETSLRYLQKVIDAKKFVLAISYPNVKEIKCNFIKSAKQNNFIPYIGNRELNTIEIINCG